MSRPRDLSLIHLQGVVLLHDRQSDYCKEHKEE
jgi:hypothetical protein